MEEPIFKAIELQDKPVNHETDFPFTDQIPGKPYLFILRTKKTLSWEPCLIFDRSEGFYPTLPLKIGQNLKDEKIVKNCEVHRGEFTKDGQWTLQIKNISTGISKYQLVFTDYGEDIVKDLGAYDVLLTRQKHINLRNLRKQTVFGRCIGNWNDWPAFLQKQVSIGYNAFHFAPIQQTGASKSYYSINDQLELANDIFQGTTQQKYEQLEKIVKPFQKQGVIFFVDIVLNHTSFDSQWVDPRSVFTIQNTKVLNSAYVLDRALLNWGNQIKSNFADSQIQMDQDQFIQLQQDLKQLIESLKLEQFFIVPDDIKPRFLNSVKTSPPSENIFAKDSSQIVLEFLQEHATNLGCQRYGVKVPDLQEKWKIENAAYEEDDLDLGIEKFNKGWIKKIRNQWIPQIIQNICGEIKYGYIQSKTRTYDDPYPFINQYFSTVHCQHGSCIQALNNGWVMDADTSVDMVTSNYFYYLRRKVCVWGDLIRIRYGNSPQDSPAWEHMSKYVRKMAKHFDGFRLDNLHGTPFLVAQYLLKEARKVNPELIIFAELFTRSQQQTATFVRRIGINSTLIELKHKLSGDQFVQLFHKIMGVSGQYTGSLSPYFQKHGHTIQYLNRGHPIYLVYDLTHDNKTYQQSGKTIVKTPLCLLLDLTGAFVGSTKGFDQFYNKKILVTQKAPLYLEDEYSPGVEEKKMMRKKITYICENETDQVDIYGSWNHWKKCWRMKKCGKRRQITFQLPEGQYEYKFLLNGKDWKSDPSKQSTSSGNHSINFSGDQNIIRYRDLQHLRKIASTYRKKYSDYREYYAYNDENVVFLLRQSKKHQDSIFIIANISKEYSLLKHNIELPGIINSADVWQQSQFDLYEGQTTSVEIINHKNIYEYFDIHHNHFLGKDILASGELPPGFACFIECSKNKQIIENIRGVKQLKNVPLRLPPLGILDYNTIMFGVDLEENQKFQISNYVIPQENKKLVYGGFGGILREIKLAKRYNNLSSKLFDNIREGDWLLDYYVGRLKRIKKLSEITDIIQRNFQCIKRLPNYLKPKYFSTFVYKFCIALEKTLGEKKSDFERRLLLASSSFFCKFDNPNPLFNVTMSAGLPFFCVGWSRCWGRDTFISNELLLLQPNIYRDTIQQYASALRHGLIPNLLDYGQNPRYNCRDASWWFIRGVCEYVQKTKDYSILKMKVEMAFLSDDIMEHQRMSQNKQKKIMTLEEIIQKILQCHADGISFREWKAGYQIDSNMSAQGFNVRLMVDDQTGFIVGGSPFNCLTWMDKMGSSARANNKGNPATPRAGSPIQLMALLYRCLTDLIRLNKEGYYPFNSVKFVKSIVTFEEWASTIKKSFEPAFYIPMDSRENGPRYYGIYKDVVNSPENLLYETYRFRPNALVALALAPELFERQHALAYLENVEAHLINQNSLGISTLGARHQTLYSAYYNNSEDSTHFKTAQGFSYHNGPQWVWLYGFYVAAKSIFNNNLRKQQLLALLQHHSKYIELDEWISLPELTDLNGCVNHHSCSSQAWSISSMILALQHIQKYGK